MWNLKLMFRVYRKRRSLEILKQCQHHTIHKHIVYVSPSPKSHIEDAIATALQAKTAWANMAWEQRAGIFSKAAELLAGPYRAKINAATMIAQSKTVYQQRLMLQN
jgi:1-pyrroline-5-carboxylate dehydrogenase